MIARRCRYDVADVSPAFGQFVVNRYVWESHKFVQFVQFVVNKKRSTIADASPVMRQYARDKALQVTTWDASIPALLIWVLVVEP